MSARLVVLAGLTLAAGAATLWWRFVRCERDCAAADRHAQDLFQRGEQLSALALVDRIDARCNCARFTSGDAPTQYALARACIQRLHAMGRGGEVHELLSRARGPILRELADHRW